MPQNDTWCIQYLKCISFKENVRISNEMLFASCSLGFSWEWTSICSRMAWCQGGNRPLLEPHVFGIKPFLCSLTLCWPQQINWLSPGRCGCNFRCIIFNTILGIDVLSTCCKFYFWSQNPINDRSALVHVMALCHLATSHYMSQCWPRSM